MRGMLLAAVGLASVVLAGCGGGGGGSATAGPAPVTPVAGPSGRAVAVTLSDSGISAPTQPTISLTENIAAGTASITGSGVSTGTLNRDGADNVAAIFVDDPNNVSRDVIVVRNNSDASLSDARFGILAIDNGTTMSVAGFHHGTQTPSSSLPSNITATYTGGFIGGEAQAVIINGQVVSGDVRGLAGDSALTANFGTGAVNGRMSNLIATNGVSANAAGYDVTVGGTMSGSAYTGTATIVAPGTSVAIGTPANSAMNGAFYGANAAETAGALTATSVSGSTHTAVIGAFGGKR